MATEATIRRWDHVIDEVEKTRNGSLFINLLVPGYKRFDQGFRLTVAAITKAFRDAWQTDRPAEGSALYAVLEPVAKAADDWDFEQPADASGFSDHAHEVVDLVPGGLSLPNRIFARSLGVAGGTGSAGPAQLR